MDNLRQTASDKLGNVDNLLQGVQFPTSKSDLLDQLQRKGAPSQVIDKVRGSNKNEFTNLNELKSMVPDLWH